MEDNTENASFDEKVNWLTERGVDLRTAVYKAHDVEVAQFFSKVLGDSVMIASSGETFAITEYGALEEGECEVIEPKQLPETKNQQP